MQRKTKQASIVQTDPSNTGSVTVSITQHIRAGKEREFEQWLQGVGAAAASFSGHQGLTVLSPAKAQRDYTYIFRFDSYAHLQDWERSPKKEQWVAQLETLTERPSDKQVATGLEYWFHLPNTAAMLPPPRRKMVAVTILGIYPLSLLVLPLVNALKLPLPSLVVRLLGSSIMVMLMTYAIMPLLTRLFARWLFPSRNASDKQ